MENFAQEHGIELSFEESDDDNVFTPIQSRSPVFDSAVQNEPLMDDFNTQATETNGIFLQVFY